MAAVFLRFPEGKRKVLTFSYDDGHPCDERLIKIFDKHGLKGTFNINYDSFMARYGETEESLKERVDLYKNHEVAVHGLTHPHLDTISQATITSEIFKDREGLESIFGYIVTGMAYPFFRAGGEATDTAMKACGIKYGRVTPPTHNFKSPTDWYNWNPTCHHKDLQLMKHAEDFLSAEVEQYSLLFYVWGHSYEFDKDDNWNVMEEFADYISGKDEVWYATNMEIYNYIEAFKKLEWSIDGSRVYNPTAQKIWFTIRDSRRKFKTGLNADFVINPGETISI